MLTKAVLQTDETQSLNQSSLSAVVEEYLKTYFAAHKSHLPHGNLHEIVMTEVERPLLEIVLNLENGNQKKAAELLGINRNTLRKKLTEHQIKVTLSA